MARDTWESRDRPVLEAIGEADADGRALERESDLPSLTGLEQREVDRALVALRDADMISGIDTTSHDGFGMLEIRILPAGRRATGQWPSGDPVQALVRLLEQRAEAADDPEEKGRLRRLADDAKDVSKQALGEILAVLIRQQTGI